MTSFIWPKQKDEMWVPLDMLGRSIDAPDAHKRCYKLNNHSLALFLAAS